MKLASAIAAASLASLVTAQAQGPTFNTTTNYFTCPVANGTYCVASNIILRCTAGIGHPGNCDDNLAGYPPQGGSAACFSCPDANDGRAACSKNGIVEPGSGSGLGSTPFAVNGSAAVCAATLGGGGAPYGNGTNPGGPIVNATGTGPVGGTSPTGGSGPGLPSSSGSPIPYAGVAPSVDMVGAGVVVGFAAVFAALGML